MKNNKIVSMLLVSIFSLLMLASFAVAEVEVTPTNVVMEIGNYNGEMLMTTMDLEFTKTGDDTETVDLSELLEAALTGWEFDLSVNSFDLEFDGDYQTVTASISVPADVDSGTYDLGSLEWTVESIDQTPINVDVNINLWKPADVVVNGLTEGKVAMEVDYSDLREDDEEETDEVTLTLKNEGELTGEVSLELLDILMDYHVEFPNAGSNSFTLDVGEEKSVVLKLTAPIDVDSGTTTDVADLKVTVNGDEVDTIDIEATVKSMMEITELDVCIDGDCEEVDESGDETDKVSPGSEVEFEVEIENLFDENYDDCDLENIEITLNFVDEGDEDDFEDEIDLDDEFDLDGEENTVVTLSFDVPVDAEEESYELVLKLEAEDENGATHTEEWIVFLDVDRERDDIRIDRADLTMNTVSSGDETSIVIKLRNYGSRDQDDVVLTVFNEALGLNFQQMNIELDENPDRDDNVFTKTIPLAISEDVLAGTFNIDVRVSLGDEEVDHRLLTLTVVGAGEEVVEDNVEVINAPVDDDVLGGDSQLTGGSVIGTVESTQSKGMTSFMIVVVVLLVILIALMLGVLIKK
ncbi:hypothetical protein GOV03_00500 [Candidatus Woesearchaeota archaeon]|nr:hypothetical protein [Candidatus Woesearchaeota archaeon]